ncbi:diguanylate cyclase [Nodosilinea sp. LEGE 07088]|uniref:diguanylate cyclase domain-containing protein n=1 Tax=Nodosilinea sp. LEGE 07088 TaxID=2777968 RepID=UPI00188145B7|nr:diguanylate cyclase [Nodosilinea sp. LEGE 07088]
MPCKPYRSLLKLSGLLDELTGLYNRRFFLELLQFEVERTRRYNQPLTLAYLDLDDADSRMKCNT